MGCTAAARTPLSMAVRRNAPARDRCMGTTWEGGGVGEYGHPRRTVACASPPPLPPRRVPNAGGRVEVDVVQGIAREARHRDQPASRPGCSTHPPKPLPQLVGGRCGCTERRWNTGGGRARIYGSRASVSSHFCRMLPSGRIQASRTPRLGRDKTNAPSTYHSGSVAPSCHRPLANAGTIAKAPPSR